MDTQPALARLIARAERDSEVLALILFGSRARGEATANCHLLLTSEMSAWF